MKQIACLTLLHRVQRYVVDGHNAQKGQSIKEEVEHPTDSDLFWEVLEVEETV